jgi:crotonobetainyl-CoA:carnitine CoA-transferase CaiB-like acyl-CoA transferase
VTLETLKGVRIVDLTMWAFVPAAGCILAHWGADVIKVENPRAPDPMRFLGGSLEPGQASPMFMHYNRGKRGIGLNLASEEGREILYQLVESADVFLTSYLPETRRKLGIDVDDIRARNPRIIYAKGTGQGPNGPEAERGGYDGATWWARGTLSNSAMQVSGAERPTAMVGHGDGMSGLTLAGGICAGLLQRALSGVASVVDGSLMGAAMWFNGPQINASRDGDVPVLPAGRQAHETLLAVQSNQYRTRDDRWISIHQLNDPDDLFVDLVAHLDRSDLATDPRFATTAARRANNIELIHILDEIFARHSLAEWKKLLATTKGVWAPIQTAHEIHQDPQTIANGFVREVNYPGGPVSLVVPPILFDSEAGDPGRAPDFCEHTDEVLAELGIDEARILGYRASGAVA